jgi:hypothetical protein
MILRGLYKLIVTAGGISLIAVVLSALAVTQSAWRIAGGSPYCIQVAGGENKYKPARTWLDLSVLNLWGIESNGYYISHHAILVVDRDRNRQQRFHWSYWRQQLVPGFVPGLRNEEAEGDGSAVACEPTPGFASGLRWIAPESADNDYVRFSTHEAYRIPKSYRAHWSGGAAGYWLQLGAPAPEFRPLKKSWEDSTYTERVGEWIIINSHASLSAKLVDAIKSDRVSVMERGIEFGLQKQKIFTEGRMSMKSATYRYFISAGETAGGPDATLIWCQTPSIHDPKSCSHSFINNGRNISFRHRTEDLANWREMQRRLLELLASFEAKGDARRAQNAR